MESLDCHIDRCIGRYAAQYVGCNLIDTLDTLLNIAILTVYKQVF